MNLHLKGNLKSLQLQAPSRGWLRSWWELAQGCSITFLQKVSRLPSICPSPAYPLPFFIFSPTVRPPSSPTTLGARRRPSSTSFPPISVPVRSCQGNSGRRDRERRRSQLREPRLFTIRSSPWWSGAPWLLLHQAAAQWGGEHWSPRPAGSLNQPQANSRSSAARREESGPACGALLRWLQWTNYLIRGPILYTFSTIRKMPDSYLHSKRGWKAKKTLLWQMLWGLNLLHSFPS